MLQVIHGEHEGQDQARIHELREGHGVRQSPSAQRLAPEGAARALLRAVLLATLHEQPECDRELLVRPQVTGEKGVYETADRAEGEQRRMLTGMPRRNQED